MEYALQVTKALILAEAHRLAHRDIKPVNLILTERADEGAVIKVVDFGLAKNYGGEGTSWSSLGTRGFIGTAHFASPEQIEESPVDIRWGCHALVHA